METTITPGYRVRLGIWFVTLANGKRAAYWYSGAQQRAWRIGLEKAELLIANGLADKVDGHPLRREVTA